MNAGSHICTIFILLQHHYLTLEWTLLRTQHQYGNVLFFAPVVITDCPIALNFTLKQYLANQLKI